MGCSLSMVALLLFVIVESGVATKRTFKGLKLLFSLCTTGGGFELTLALTFGYGSLTKEADFGRRESVFFGAKGIGLFVKNLPNGCLVPRKGVV